MDMKEACSQANMDLIEIMSDNQGEIKKVDFARLQTEPEPSEEGTPVLRLEKLETAENKLNQIEKH